MSFYVSDSLKDRITEKEISRDSDSPSLIELEDEKNFDIVFSDMLDEFRFFEQIRHIKLESENSLLVCISTGIQNLEKIFFKKLHAREIVIGNTKRIVNDYSLISVKKNESNFLLEIIVYI